MISIFLDPEMAIRLRWTINHDIDFSYKHTKERKKDKKQYPAWNRICAIMDRIQDTAEHINDIKLQENKKDDRGAFDFLDLMNHSSVLIDCIYEIARIYGIDMTQYSISTDIFHEPGKDNEGSDKLYFEYLRSLCSAHPFDTGRHKNFQDGDYECCPYVYWGDEIPGTGMHYVNAMVYSDELDMPKVLSISTQRMKEYIEYVYGLIDSVIIPGIETFKERRRNEFREQKMKPVESFADYIDYLNYLKEEARKRYSADNDYYIDEAILFFSVNFNEKKNQTGLRKLQNALKLAISFFHNSLQNMSWEGYENTGIKYPEETDSEFLLHCLLFNRNNSKKAMDYGYEIGTLHELRDEENSSYVYGQINNMRSFLEKYISLEGEYTRKEMYVLTQIALYADALRNKNLINQNIPNDLKYRYRCLSEKSLENLRKPFAKKQRDKISITLEDYRKAVQEFLGDDEN